MMKLYSMYWMASQRVKEVFSREEGQGMVEYGLILALVAVVVIGLLATMGGQIQEVFQDIVDKLPGDGE